MSADRAQSVNPGGGVAILFGAGRMSAACPCLRLLQVGAQPVREQVSARCEVCWVSTDGRPNSSLLEERYELSRQTG